MDAPVHSQLYSSTHKRFTREKCMQRLFMPTAIMQQQKAQIPLHPRIFSVSCHGLKYTRVTQTDLTRISHELCRNHLDISRWHESSKLPYDIPVYRFIVCVCYFRDRRLQLSPKLPLRRNGMRAKRSVAPRLPLISSFSWRVLSSA